MDTSVNLAPSALDQTNQSLASDADVLAAVASMQSSFVVVCFHTDKILLQSEGMRALLPTTEINTPWRTLISQEAELLAAYENAVDSGAAESIGNVEIAGSKRRVDFKKYGDNQLILSVHSEPVVDKNLHEYMQARDNLFSTSRTISVSEMATTLAHELNTPIGTISNILSGVKMRLKKPDASLDKIDQALDRALDQTQFSQKIISRIRDFTQSRRPKLSVLDVRKQLEEAVVLLDWLLSHNECQVELQVPDEPLYISGDATMLQQVLINLIRNAVDAMYQQSKERRKIVIAAQSNEQKVTLSIADTGHGLDGNDDKLFVPFATTKSSGMGVGLNICRSFIELHQGRLWLSPNEDEGCTCFVELPVASQEELQRRGSV